jgi:uncharacterized protein
MFLNRGDNTMESGGRTKVRIIPTNLVGKYSRLKEILGSMDSVLVAFSGGVDSSLLLKVSSEVLGERAMAVTANSPTYQQREIKEARGIARSLKVRFMVINSDEFQSALFRKNTPFRCYHCKLSLFSKLKKIAREHELAQVIEGSNLDDDLDYRPGNKAIQKLRIRSPLKEAGFRKKDIRELARILGLPSWNKPSMACLASRIPFNQPIEVEVLRRIEKAEEYLRQTGFSQVRVRHHGEIARIEVNPAEFNLLMDEENRKKIASRLKRLGYRYTTVDIEGYRTGSLNPEGKSYNRKIQNN